MLGTEDWGALYGGATHDQPWATSPEGDLGVTPVQAATTLMDLECSKIHFKIPEQNRNTEYPELEGTHQNPAHFSAQDSPENPPSKMPALRNGFAGMSRFSTQPQFCPVMPLFKCHLQERSRCWLLSCCPRSPLGAEPVIATANRVL